MRENDVYRDPRAPAHESQRDASVRGPDGVEVTVWYGSGGSVWLGWPAPPSRWHRSRVQWLVPTAGYYVSPAEAHADAGNLQRVHPRGCGPAASRRCGKKPNDTAYFSHSASITISVLSAEGRSH